jgi:tyrosyl-tRNA synthetase
LLFSRSISQAYLRKKADAEKRWQEKAKEIKAGKMDSMLSFLEKRGFVDSIAG